MLGYTVTEALAEGDHDGYVLPVAEGVTVAVTDALALALALALTYERRMKKVQPLLRPPLS